MARVALGEIRSLTLKLNFFYAQWLPGRMGLPKAVGKKFNLRWLGCHLHGEDALSVLQPPQAVSDNSYCLRDVRNHKDEVYVDVSWESLRKYVE